MTMTDHDHHELRTIVLLSNLWACFVTPCLILDHVELSYDEESNNLQRMLLGCDEDLRTMGRTLWFLVPTL